MAQFSISLHPCEFCGLYHLVTSGWDGLETGELYEEFVCIPCLVLVPPMPTRGEVSRASRL